MVYYNFNISGKLINYLIIFPAGVSIKRNLCDFSGRKCIAGTHSDSHKSEQSRETETCHLHESQHSRPGYAYAVFQRHQDELWTQSISALNVFLF